MTDPNLTIEVRGERFLLVEARHLVAGVTMMADKLDQEPGITTQIYEDDQETTLFGGHSWTAPELRELARELTAALREAEQPDRSRAVPGAGSVWFRPLGGQCDPGRIRVLLRYIGTEPLVNLMVTASGDHVVDVGNQGLIFDGLVADLGDVAPDGNVLIMVRTDGSRGPLEFILDLRDEGGAARRLVVTAPVSGGKPVVTEQPAD